VSEQGLRCEMVASSYSNQSYADSIFRLHSDHTRGCVVAGVLHRTTDYPTVVFIGLWPHSFHKIMYFYNIYLVSTMCCDATITEHKRNTNIQELRTLPNTLLTYGAEGLTPMVFIYCRYQ
jgi:hypothetical protein